MKYHDGKLTKRKRPKMHRRRRGAPRMPAKRVFTAIRIEGDARAELQDGLPPIPMRIILHREEETPR